MSYIDRAMRWLGSEFDEEVRAEVRRMIDDKDPLLEEAFYKNLEFGTGGLRGVMGVGTNRVNRYTIGMATQGLANYLKSVYVGKEDLGVAISFDNRNNSKFFAEVTAGVFSMNGFKVFLFESLRPTPELSFTIRELGCVAGVMITASHNPKEYNGYKVFWKDGGQVVYPDDVNIVQEVEKITDIKDVKFGGLERVTLIGEMIDSVYLKTILSLTLSPEIADRYGKNIKIVYTPLHGTGVRLVPEALRRVGFSEILYVPEQNVIDGDFPTVKSPNPEEPSALEMALRKADMSNADIVMATDPDADRLGIAIRDSDNKMFILNGNQTASILTYYLLERKRERGEIGEVGKNGYYYMVKTIVTTDLIKSIADYYGVEVVNVLTGFKYIAEVVKKNEGKRVFIGGGEESYGFNAGEFVRDKDAVISAVLFAEAVAWANSKGMTAYQLMLEIYQKFGFYKERLLSITKKGLDGIEQISKIMERLRSEPPHRLVDSDVVLINDFRSGVSIDLISDLRHRIELPKSDVLQFITTDGSIVSIRPSGTEPKIKFYFGVKETLPEKTDFATANIKSETKLNALQKQIESFLL